MKKILIILELILISILVWLIISRVYIFHYNKGNKLYENGEYEEAQKEYYKALEGDPKKGFDCKIRINLALTKLQDFKMSDSKEEIEKNIEILKSAREVLCENNCAGEDDDNGHSKKAEELKADIDKMLEELEEALEEEQEEDDENKDDSDEQNQSKEDADVKDVQEKLLEIQKESFQERQEEMDFYSNDDYSYIYYHGKRW